MVPERRTGPGRGPAVLYKASSPDDGALVQAARELGYEFYHRDASGVRVRQFGAEVHYEVLNVNAFSSDRRCMSVIVRAPNGKIVLYAKGNREMTFAALLLCLCVLLTLRCTRAGADEVILPNLREDVIGSEEDAATQNNLAEFASAGLRTLVLARAELDPVRYADWNARVQFASLQPQREARLAELALEYVFGTQGF